MLRWVADFLVTALDEDPDLDVYWEWTYLAVVGNKVLW